MLAAGSMHHLGDRIALRRRLLSSSFGRSFRPAPPPGQFPAPPFEDQQSGAIVLSSKALRSLLTDKNQELLDGIIRKCSAGWPWPDTSGYLRPEQVLEFAPGMFHFGLDPGLLEMAETYLEGPCLYLGPVLKREAVDRQVDGTRQWHTDVEDDRIVRLLIYLSAVAKDCGPFEYLPTKDTARVRAETGYKSGYRTDGWLKHAVPWAKPRRCTGGPGSAVLFDGANVLHRAGQPERSERLSVTFTYLTRRPLQLFREARLSRTARTALCRSLSEREQACIPRARWL